MQGKHLVTGGAGFIGSHLSRRLVNDGYEVLGVDNLSSGSRRNIQDLIGKPNYKFIKGDLRHSGLCLKVTKGMDYVWSLAATMGGIGFITAVHADIMRDNAIINLNMLEAARQNNVSHYFYSSSACAYNSDLQTETDVMPLKESDAYPANPDQSYGWEKIFTEQACLAFAKDYGMNIRIARFHNIFGPCFTAFDKVKGKAPAHMIIKAIKHPQSPFVIWGDGQQTRSFLYIDDCLDGILRLVGSDYKEPINIGSDRLISMTDLAKMAVDLAGKKVEFEYDLSKPQGVRGRNASLELVEKVLGWRPKVTLKEGMGRTFQWAVNHYDELEGI